MSPEHILKVCHLAVGAFRNYWGQRSSSALSLRTWPLVRNFYFFLLISSFFVVFFNMFQYPRHICNVWKHFYKYVIRFTEIKALKVPKFDKFCVFIAFMRHTKGFLQQLVTFPWSYICQGISWSIWICYFGSFVLVFCWILDQNLGISIPVR